MNPESDAPSRELPSKRKLAMAIGLALVTAGGILVTIVLPAEYGIDPFGTGAALGLNRLSSVAPLPEELAPRGATLTPVQEGPASHYAAEYKVDSTQFTLGPYEYVEYKYHLEKGAALLYSWTANAQVIHDFHGQPNGGKPDDEESFDKQARRHGYGSFNAPFSGIHGWMMLGGAPLSAHEEFRIIGTVTKRTEPQLQVKSKAGKTIVIALNKETLVSRDKVKVVSTELKIGRSVVVDALGDSEAELLALEVRLVPAIAPSPAK